MPSKKSDPTNSAHIFGSATWDEIDHQAARMIAADFQIEDEDHYVSKVYDWSAIYRANRNMFDDAPTPAQRALIWQQLNKAVTRFQDELSHIGSSTASALRHVDPECLETPEARRSLEALKMAGLVTENNFRGLPRVNFDALVHLLRVLEARTLWLSQNERDLLTDERGQALRLPKQATSNWTCPAFVPPQVLV